MARRAVSANFLETHATKPTNSNKKKRSISTNGSLFPRPASDVRYARIASPPPKEKIMAFTNNDDDVYDNDDYHLCYDHSDAMYESGIWKVG